MQNMSQKGKTKEYRAELTDLERIFFRRRQLIYKSEALVAAALNNTELNADTWKKSGLYDDRKKLVESDDAGDDRDGRPTKDNRKQENNPDSKTISFEMLEDGRGIEQIAKERGLAVSTVEGHIAHFIRTGELDVLQVMEEDQVEEILDKAQEIGADRFPRLRKALGNRYSYGQLKMALASPGWFEGPGR